MACCFLTTRNIQYLPKELATKTEHYETEYFFFNSTTNSVDCKLLRRNPYHKYFEQVYPSEINENELTDEMLDIIRSYTDSQSNDCYMKTNLNLLSAHFDQIDWNYVNRLRSLIRALNQSNIKPIYYRGLYLSDREIQYYIDHRGDCYYTNSFLSFTIDRLLIYPGNAILILRTDQSSSDAKRNLANIWRWSTFIHEKEALLAVGTKLKILSVHYYGDKWEIELALADDDDDD